MPFGNLWKYFSEYWTAGVEILIIALVLYYSYLYLRGTRGARILFALAVIFITLTLLTQFLNLTVIGWLLRSFSVFLAIALVVIFQPELRRALTELGSHHFFASSFQQRETLEEITDTVFELSSKGIGALIAIEREVGMRQIVETGVAIDCHFTKELLLTIFHPKTVLHDGGAIVRNDRLVAAACIFPLTQREDLDRNLGLRHRAGLGLSEETDAVCIIVSEETGQVSVCHNGVIERNLNVERFRRLLEQLMLLDKNDSKDPDAKLEGEAGLPDAGSGDLVSHKKQHHQAGISS